jgi:hypothetical protein
MNNRWFAHPQRVGNNSDTLSKPLPVETTPVASRVRQTHEARPAMPAGEFVGQKWGMRRLFFVDEQVIMTFLSRLLATGLRDPLLRSKGIGDFRDEIDKTRMPTDLNMSLLAVCLLEASEGLISEVGKDPEPYLDQPTWLEGTVTSVEALRDRRQVAAGANQSARPAVLGLRLRSNDGAGMLLRLNNATSQGWGRSDLQKTRIQAIGLLCRPRYRHVTAAAVSQLDSSGIPEH